MPHHVFTRQALYERVWAEPIRTVARGLGVSDVGLAKACRAAEIPVPPRGYWAKLHHGKPVAKPPLLPERPDKPDQVVIAPAPPRPAPSPALQAVAAALAEAAPIPVPADLRGAHPIVRGWVDDNAERRRQYRRDGWGLSGLEDLSTPLARRRLRLTSALLKALEQRKLEVGGGREGVTVSRGGETLAVSVYERGKVEMRPATTDELRWQPKRKMVRATVPAGDLVVKIREWLSVPTEFKELKVPLDAQLPAIVASLEAGLDELAERRRQRALEDKRRADERAEQRRRDAYREAEVQLRERLFGQAERWREVQTLRAYIAAADGSPAAQWGDYAGWRAWAMAQADAADPLRDGSAPFDRLPPIEAWDWRGW